MNSIQKLTVNGVIATMLFILGGCAGMTNLDKNTAIGAGVGAVGGNRWQPCRYDGGAAVGGVIGHEVTE